MLTETPTTRVRYGAGISATALAHPGVASGYRTPSGALMGGFKSSLGHEIARAEADGLRRYRSGPAVLEDYQLHEKGRLLGEMETRSALGESSSGTVTWDEALPGLDEQSMCPKGGSCGAPWYGPAAPDAAPAPSSGWGTWIGLAAVAALMWSRK